MYIDPIITPFILEGRGLSRLRLKITSSDGAVVRTTAGVPPDVVNISWERLLLLDCGTFHGLLIKLDSPPWRAALKPGTYSVSAVLEIDSRRNLPVDSVTAQHLAARAAVPVELISRLLPNFTLTSNSITLRIVRK
jgi:hypothetical protein